MNIIILWLPAEDFAGLVTGRYQGIWVPWPPRCHLGRNFLAGYFPGCFQHLLVGEARRRTKVKGVAFIAGFQILDCQDVGICQVHHVDVIPHVGSIRRVVVIPKDAQFLALAFSDLHDDWDQVRFWPVVFPNRTIWRGPSNVKVAQGHKLDAVRLVRPSHHFFHHQLREAIRIDRLLRIGFLNRHVFRNPVGRRRGGEDNVLDPKVVHSF